MSVGRRSGVIRPSAITRGFIPERNHIDVRSVGYLLAKVQLSFSTGGFTQERNPFNVTRVGRLSDKAHRVLPIREFIPERNPMNAVRVGNFSTTGRLLRIITKSTLTRAPRRYSYMCDSLKPKLSRVRGSDGVSVTDT